MNLQSVLNNQSIAKLNIISLLIDEADSFEANQMKNKTIQAMVNLENPFDEKCSASKEAFESDLIAIFLDRGWISENSKISLSHNDYGDTFFLNVDDINELKKYDLLTAYKIVMKRPSRKGLPRLFITCGDKWIKGTVGNSNLGCNFRGQMSGNLYPSINSNMSFFEMLTSH